MQWLLIGGTNHGQVVGPVPDGNHPRSAGSFPSDYSPNNVMWHGKLYRLGVCGRAADRMTIAAIGALIDSTKLEPIG